MSILKSMLMEADVVEPTINGYAFESINCETDVIEACESYNEIVSDEEAIERLMEIHAGLESLLEISERSLEDGGLTAVNAEVLRISTAALVAPLGIEPPILAKESFGAEGERLTSTRVSIEEERGTLGKIWDAIKRTMASLREKIKAWFGRIFSVTEKLRQKNVALMSDIDGLSGKSVKDDNKKFEFSAGALLAKGQSEGDLNGNLENLVGEVTDFIKNNAARSKVSDMVDVFNSTDFVSGGAPAISQFNSKLKKTIKDFTEISNSAKGTGIPKAMNIPNTIITKFGILPGNKALFSYYSEDDTKTVFSSGWKLGIHKDGADMKGKTEFNVLSVSDLKALGGTNKELLEIIVGYKKDKAKADAIKEKIVKAGDDLTKKIKGGGEGTKNTAGAKNALSILKKFENFLDSPANELTNLTVKSVAAILGLMGTMVKAYE